MSTSERIGARRAIRLSTRTRSGRDGRALERLSRPQESPSEGRFQFLENQNKRGRPRGSRSCLWVVEEGLLGWGWSLERRLDDVDGLPVAAEVLRDPGRQLESHPQAAGFEEAVGG